MASSKNPAFDEMAVVTGDDNQYDDDGEWLDLEAGESVVGEIRAINENCGKHDTTVLELSRGLGDNVTMWSNRQIDRVLQKNEIGVGEVVGIKHTTETDTFTPSGEDEPVTFDVWEVRSGLDEGGD
ncbi:hypothetical protein ACOJIV_22755 [Haloarcula sp. AONF1]